MSCSFAARFSSEPGDEPDQLVTASPEVEDGESEEDDSARHPGLIPASGRGNSPEGNYWVNPTGDQIMRACARKNKNFDDKVKNEVAMIHGDVTAKTWQQIMEYEGLHSRSCKFPKLARFSGRQDEFTMKARLLMWLGFPPPFDRHDWVVDRCGKEVRYIIDYHSPPDSTSLSDGSSEVVIDARPAFTLGGIRDRVRLPLAQKLFGYHAKRRPFLGHNPEHQFEAPPHLGRS